MKNREQIIEKILNLMSLSKSDNPNESALAAKRAQEMIERHRIDDAEIKRARQEDTQRGVGDVNLFLVHRAGRLYIWQHVLAAAIAEENYCRYMTNGEDMLVAGAREDAQLVGWLYQVFVNEIQGMFDTMYKSNHPFVLQMMGVSKDKRKSRNSFFLGASSRIGERLKEARAKARKQAQKEAGSQEGLVCINESIAALDNWEQRVVKYAADKTGRTKKVKGVHVDPHAFAVGSKAGNEVELNRNRPVGE